MKKTFASILTVMILFNIVINLNAQTQTEVKSPKNSIITSKQQTIIDKHLSPLPDIQEANVMWKKTIIREIDFRQKINQPFYYPLDTLEDWKNFITVIYDAIKGGLTVYKVEDKIKDMVNPFNSFEEFRSANVKTTTNLIFNNETGENEYEVIQLEKRMIDVTRLQIKEDWYFDKHLSQFLVRIIALCPIIMEDDGPSEICWIPYEPARKILAEAFVYNIKNPSERRSYDEILQKRIFDSYIIKEENVFDRSVKDYAMGIDALYESERIKNELFDFEQSLWEY